MNWTYEKLEFSIDSVLIYTYRPAVRNTSTWPFDKPFFMIMNVAMGGNWGSDPQYETGGLKNGIDPALNSARMEVDYVRVYQYPAAVNDDQGSLQGFGSLFVSPNPSNGKIRVKLPVGIPVQGNIHNMAGANVFQFESTTGPVDLDLSSLPKGIYLLSILSGGEIHTQKMILN